MAEWRGFECALEPIVFLPDSFDVLNGMTPSIERKPAPRWKSPRSKAKARAVNFRAIVPHMFLRNAALTANPGQNKAQAPWLKLPFPPSPRRKA